MLFFFACYLSLLLSFSLCLSLPLDFYLLSWNSIRYVCNTCVYFRFFFLVVVVVRFVCSPNWWCVILFFILSVSSLTFFPSFKCIARAVMLSPRVRSGAVSIYLSIYMCSCLSSLCVSLCVISNTHMYMCCPAIGRLQIICCILFCILDNTRALTHVTDTTHKTPTSIKLQPKINQKRDLSNSTVHFEKERHTYTHPYHTIHTIQTNVHIHINTAELNGKQI